MQEIFEILGKNKKELFGLIFMEELTDIEAANQLHISRQYVHRMRKNIMKRLKNIFCRNYAGRCWLWAKKKIFML